MDEKEKKSENEKVLEFPSLELLEGALEKERDKNSFSHMLRNTFFSLLVVAAVAVLVVVLVMPVFQITGTSMTNTLQDGDVVLSVKCKSYRPGDVIAFYYNNDILIKRVIAVSGDWVEIDPNGMVYVNSEALDEPYVREHALGDCNIDMPYQVPDGCFFVMGDHRATSIDSRNKTVGCVSGQMIAGKLLLRIWPLAEIKWLW